MLGWGERESDLDFFFSSFYTWQVQILQFYICKIVYKEMS